MRSLLYGTIPKLYNEFFVYTAVSMCSRFLRQKPRHSHTEARFPLAPCGFILDPPVCECGSVLFSMNGTEWNSQ